MQLHDENAQNFDQILEFWSGPQIFKKVSIRRFEYKWSKGTIKLKKGVVQKLDPRIQV